MRRNRKNRSLTEAEEVTEPEGTQNDEMEEEKWIRGKRR